MAHPATDVAGQLINGLTLVLTNNYALGLLIFGWGIGWAVNRHLSSHRISNLQSDVDTAQREASLARQEASAAQRKATAASRAAVGTASSVSIAVDQAQGTTQATRQFVASVVKMFRWEAEARKHGGVGPLQEAQRNAIMQEMLDSASLVETDLKRLDELALPFVRWRYAEYVTEAVSLTGWTREQLEAWNKYFKSETRRGIGYEPSPDQLREFLEAHGFANDEVKERLKDYATWDAKREHRRLAQWSDYANRW